MDKIFKQKDFFLKKTWTVSWSANPAVKRIAASDVITICEDEAC